MPKIVFLLLIISATVPTIAESNAQDLASDSQQLSAAAPSETSYLTRADLRYRGNADGSKHEKKMCRLDVYYPKDKQNFSTVVWFHGGGLTSGNKEIPAGLRRQGIAVVAPNYRLYPKAKSPIYIEDAAAAVAWVFQNIEKYGGDPEKIFISGHSAGGYLTLMLGLDKKYLAAHEIDADDVAGLIPYSGHAITHFTVRSQNGIAKDQPIIDAMAPLFHIRKDASPLLLITGDRSKELLGRYEETAYLWRMMQVVGHSQTTLSEMKDCDHNTMVKPAHELLLKFVADQENRVKSPN